MSDHHDRPHGPATPAIDAEIDVRGIVKIGAWIAGITIGSFVAMYFTYIGVIGMQEKSDPRPSPVAPAATAGAALTTTPPGPHLQAGTFDEHGRQVLAERELQEMRAAEDEWLASYGWVDRTAGYVHVPIDRALELELARHGAAPAPAGP